MIYTQNLDAQSNPYKNINLCPHAHRSFCHHLCSLFLWKVHWGTALLRRCWSGPSNSLECRCPHSPQTPMPIWGAHAPRRHQRPSEVPTLPAGAHTPRRSQCPFEVPMLPADMNAHLRCPHSTKTPTLVWGAHIPCRCPRSTQTPTPVWDTKLAHTFFSLVGEILFS